MIEAAAIALHAVSAAALPTRRAFLPGITPQEPVSQGLAPITATSRRTPTLSTWIPGMSAALATCLPLRHAQRADPMEVLGE
jgi:hypothetical protein